MRLAGDGSIVLADFGHLLSRRVQLATENEAQKDLLRTLKNKVVLHYLKVKKNTNI
jgi:hypothetical protein